VYAQAGHLLIDCAFKQVIAIDPNWQTLRHLAASVVLGNLTDRVTLLNNAITNVSGSVVRLGLQPDNRGMTRVLPANLCGENSSIVECIHGAGTVQTITLNDLLQFRPSAAGQNQVSSKWHIIMKVIEFICCSFFRKIK
jgi:hypothetical protein